MAWLARVLLLPRWGANEDVEHDHERQPEQKANVRAALQAQHDALLLGLYWLEAGLTRSPSNMETASGYADLPVQLYTGSVEIAPCVLIDILI